MSKGILEKRNYELGSPDELESYCLTAQTTPNPQTFFVASTFAQEVDSFYPLFIRFGNRPPKLFGIAKDLTEADKRNYEKLRFEYSKVYASFEDKTKRAKKERVPKEIQKKKNQRPNPKLILI